MNRHSLKYVLCHKFAGLAQQGERLPYKQDVGGSSPSFCTMQAVADTAYPHKVCTLSSTLRSATMVCSSMVEHPAVNRRVVGSSPTIPASKCSIMASTGDFQSSNASSILVICSKRMCNISSIKTSLRVLTE